MIFICRKLPLKTAFVQFGDMVQSVMERRKPTKIRGLARSIIPSLEKLTQVSCYNTACETGNMRAWWPVSFCVCAWGSISDTSCGPMFGSKSDDGMLKFDPNFLFSMKQHK